MKIELKFDFEVEYEKELFWKMMVAENAFYVICDIYNKIRSTEKRGAEHITMQDFRNIIEEHNLNWDFIS